MPKKSAPKKTASETAPKKSIEKNAPKCKGKFPAKPALARNTTLAETVKGEMGKLRAKSRTGEMKKPERYSDAEEDDDEA
jgi:hypothetical protein